MYVCICTPTVMHNIGHFDCVMKRHKYVCEIVIRCKLQEKNYCKLQFI